LHDILTEKKLKRILMINFGGIGDEILFYPVIESLRSQYPEAHLSILVEPRCRNLLEHHYYLDSVLTFDIKHRKSPADLLELLNLIREAAPELVVSSGGSSMVAPLLFLSGAPYRAGYDSGRFPGLLTHRAPLNQKQYAAQMYYDLLLPLGFPEQPVTPQMSLPGVVKDWASTWLESQGLSDQRFVLIHPGVSLMSKEKNLIKSWARDNWLSLMQQLLDEGEHVVLAGGPDDAEEIDYLLPRLADHPHLHLAYGQTRDLYQLGALIERSASLICVDSAPMHLGVALNAPVVAIFGPTDDRLLLPPGEQLHLQAVTHPVACRPCLWATRNTTCDTLDCLVNISVEQVYQALRQLMPVAVKESVSTSSC